MFESNTSMRKFGKYESDASGIGAGITRIESMDDAGATAAKVNAVETYRGSFGGDRGVGDKYPPP